MKLLVVNPNSTAAMTEKIARAARAVARPETEIVATNPAAGPPSIEGYLDVAECLPHLLEEVARHQPVDAVVVACFDDTGVEALRCTTIAPVIGIGEAAYHAAAMISPRFAVVTTLSRSLAGLEANLRHYGLDRKCAAVRATDVPVLALEEGDPATIDKIRKEIRQAIDHDKAEAIVLGCAGMTDLMDRLAHEFHLPVVDGVAAAVTFAEALVQSNLATSKLNTYAPHHRHP